MAQKIEPTLYIDHQAEIPVQYCPECGGALFRPGLICIRCQRAQL